MQSSRVQDRPSAEDALLSSPTQGLLVGWTSKDGGTQKLQKPAALNTKPLQKRSCKKPDKTLVRAALIPNPKAPNQTLNH